MKVKELKEQLNNFDENLDVVIRFALDEEDDIGYCLEPVFVNPRISDIAIYAEYTATELDCAIMGQKDLKKLWKEDKE